MNLRKLIGNKAFYKTVMYIVLPIMIQNGITSFVGLLDNIMVGQLGTPEMSGVAVANTLQFIFYLCTFGRLSGAGIFTAQFFGNGDLEGVRHTFRFKVYLAIGIGIAFFAIYYFFGDELIMLFLNDKDVTNVEKTLQAGHLYLNIMLFGLLPFTLTQVYSSTLRETGETALPMYGGIAAVLVNLVLNYVLIYGKLGLPAMGVAGAAYATLISRVVELLIVVIGTHRNTRRYPFIVGMYRSMRIPGHIAWDVARRGGVLMLNELLFAVGESMMNQCYSTRGLAVVAAVNIMATVNNLFSIAFMAMGNAVGILVGQQLGAGQMERARETDTKMIAFAVAVAFCTTGLLLLAAPWIPMLYKTEQNVRDLATQLLRVCACMMPVRAFLHCAYFTMRSGGKTVLTFFFDCGYMWVLSIPLAFVLAHFTEVGIVPMFMLVVGMDLAKVVVGAILLKKGLWMNNIIGNGPPREKTA